MREIGVPGQQQRFWDQPVHVRTACKVQDVIISLIRQVLLFTDGLLVQPWQTPLSVTCPNTLSSTVQFTAWQGGSLGRRILNCLRSIYTHSRDFFCSKTCTSAHAPTSSQTVMGGFFTRHRNVYLYVPNLVGMPIMLMTDVSVAVAATVLSGCGWHTLANPPGVLLLCRICTHPAHCWSLGFCSSASRAMCRGLLLSVSTCVHQCEEGGTVPQQGSAAAC